MNPSDWIKAAALVTQHKQEAATTEMDQLSSMPLSQVSKVLEKYLQDAEQCHALELNYFDDNASCGSEEPNLEGAEQTIQASKGNPLSAKQTYIEDIDVARNAPESLKSDTSHTS